MYACHPHHPDLVLQPPSHRWYSACPRHHHHHHHLQLQNVRVARSCPPSSPTPPPSPHSRGAGGAPTLVTIGASNATSTPQVTLARAQTFKVSSYLGLCTCAQPHYHHLVLQPLAQGARAVPLATIYTQHTDTHVRTGTPVSCPHHNRSRLKLPQQRRACTHRLKTCRRRLSARAHEGRRQCTTRHRHAHTGMRCAFPLISQRPKTPMPETVRCACTSLSFRRYLLIFLFCSQRLPCPRR